LNYRHDFHAGNFADLVKHACLLSALRVLTGAARPLLVVDTHAGAGLYDLTGEMAQRSGESVAGVARLMADADAPAPFGRLKTAIAQANPAGGLRWYPGSPLLISKALRPGDRLIACELRRDDFARLARTVGDKAVQCLCEDGYDLASARLADLVLIDPPFERADEYERIVATVKAVLRRNPNTALLVWLPLKDLETFDGFIRRLEALHPPPTLVVEARLRPLDDPMRLNGCATVMLNPPTGLDEEARLICDWTVASLGESGGAARCWRLDD
jgi:23S rRNA (adenine2030-N6)-methyltransferase